MAGIIKYMAPIESASGKILGRKEKFTSVTRTWGNKRNGCNITGKRNLQLKPYSSDEQTQHSKFAQAVPLKKLVLEDLMLRAQWATRFHNDTTTKCTTLNGYLQQQAMKGHIADDGSFKA